MISLFFHFAQFVTYTAATGDIIIWKQISVTFFRFCKYMYMYYLAWFLLNGIVFLLMLYNRGINLNNKYIVHYHTKYITQKQKGVLNSTV